MHTRQICRGSSPPRPPGVTVSRDGGGAGRGEWYLSSKVTFEACGKACNGLRGWGCSYISWEMRDHLNQKGAEGVAYCYLHRRCVHRDSSDTYDIYQRSHTEWHGIRHGSPNYGPGSYRLSIGFHDRVTGHNWATITCTRIHCWGKTSASWCNNNGDPVESGRTCGCRCRRSTGFTGTRCNIPPPYCTGKNNTRWGLTPTARPGTRCGHRCLRYRGAKWCATTSGEGWGWCVQCHGSPTQECLVGSTWRRDGQVWGTRCSGSNLFNYYYTCRRGRLVSNVTSCAYTIAQAQAQHLVKQYSPPPRIDIDIKLRCGTASRSAVNRMACVNRMANLCHLLGQSYHCNTSVMIHGCYRYCGYCGHRRIRS